MRHIEVLGSGCSSCQTLYERTRQAVGELGLDCRVEKITDLNVILGYRVMSTPALVVDGEVKLTGRVPSTEQLKALLS